MVYKGATIRNQEFVTDVYGEWPSFHDAELIDLSLNRIGSTEYGGPDLGMRIHLFEMTRDVDSNGYYVLKNHRLVTMLFAAVDNVSIDGFNHQNAIDELVIRDITDRQWDAHHFEVEVVPHYGACLLFVCREIIVEKVEEYNPTRLQGDPKGTQGPPRAL